MNNNKIKKTTQAHQQQNHKMKAVWLSCSVLSSLLVFSSVASASDIEIYQPATGNKKRLMLMVDQSRSMGGAGLLGLVKDYPLCIGGGVTNIVGDLNLGVKVAGKTDLIDITKEATDLVNQVVLKGLLGDGQGKGILDSIAEIKTEQPNTTYPFLRQSCTVVTTDATVKLLDNLLKGILGVSTGLSAEQYIRETCDPLIDIRLLKSITHSSTVGIYRCYDKTSRVRMALTDVLQGKKGEAGLPDIEQIPDNTLVGLSVSPYDHQVNDRAGAIIFEPKLLSERYAYNGKTQTHRQHLIDYIASSNMDSKGDFNVGSLLFKGLPELIGAVLTDVLNKVAGILTNPLGSVSSLLEFEKTNQKLNDLLKVLGLGGNSPLASTYAETGAYLLGNTTKGTGARQEAMRLTPVKLLGIPLLGWYDYKCTVWEADKATCKKDGWTFVGGRGVNTSAYKAVSTDLIDSLVGGDGVVGGLLSGVVGSLVKVGGKELYYAYTTEADGLYSGFADSQRNSAIIQANNANFYQKPATTPECDANGLMVIAGNVPNISPTVTDVLLQSRAGKVDGTEQAIERLMGRSLDSKQTLAIQYQDGGDATRREWGFKCKSTDLVQTRKGDGDFATWKCIGSYATEIRGLSANSIKTAVIGLDRSFLQLPAHIAGQENSTDTKGLNQINTTTVAQDSLLGGFLPTTVKNLLDALAIGPLGNGVKSLLNSLLPPDEDDIKNMARWGVIGGGGWYNAANSQNIAQSIKDFHDNLGVTEGDPIGLQTLPEDPLTPYQMANDVYKSMFEPTEKASWFGNFKKYYVDTDNAVNKLKDAWDASSTTYDVQDWNKGGVLAKLKNLKNKTDNSDPTKPIITERKVLINRDCQQIGNTTTYQFTEVGGLKTVDKKYLDIQCGSGSSAFTDAKGYLLMNLLGYSVGSAATTADLTEANRTNWKLGMNLHSTPIKLTQEAIFNADNSIKQRKDYMLFGTTQGLLHVVDAKTGEESFAFVPNEMLENTQQSNAFVEKPSGIKDQMAYGIDGAWSVYSEYVYGMNAVSSGSTSSEVIATVGEIKKDSKVLAKGKQIAYGGLRMGGRSYYALDLSDIAQPKLKFHIDPDNNRIISLKSDGTYQSTTNTALASMGQSWSKPTITRINWNGELRQVMIVGGGYDTAYESLDYNYQAGEKGNAVYIFDADNGELLWWSSANADSSLEIDPMKYSIVSRINAVDRNGDGLTDHLYFGDLGGQVWRIDLDRDFGKTSSDGKVKNNGSYSLLFTKANERFYEAPNFSVYGNEQPLAVISIASGNRSRPFKDSNSGSAIYNLFDQEVVRHNFTSASNNNVPKILITDLKAMLTASEVKGKNLAQVKAMIPNGWYVQANTVVGKELDAQGNEVKLNDQDGSKVLSEMVVMNKNLYASVYNPNTAAGNSCKIQANGATTVQRFCLPFGVCEQDIKDVTMSFGAGHGIVDSMVGAGIGLGDKNGLARQLLNPNAKDKIGNGKFPVNTMRRQLVPLTWYEQNE